MQVPFIPMTPSTQTYQKLVDFIGANGSSPLGAMTWVNGKFYGLANRGGSNGVGNIYCFDPTANTLTDVYDMDSSSGILPNGIMYLVSGKLYYSAAGGGAYSGGTIMSFDPATKTCTDIYDFGPHSGPIASAGHRSTVQHIADRRKIGSGGRNGGRSHRYQCRSL